MDAFWFESPVWFEGVGDVRGRRLGACIQLLLHASETNQQPKKVTKELKTPKTASTVKDPLAIEVVRIQMEMIR